MGQTEGPPPSGGPGGAGNNGAPIGDPASLVLDLAAMQPAHPQDALKAGDHIIASGTMTGGCAGNVSIHAISSEASNGATGPYTVLDTKGTEFSIALPKNTALFLIPHCDSNADGKIDMAAGDAIGSRVDVAASSADVSGLVLDFKSGPTGGPPSGGPPGQGQGGMQGQGGGLPPAGPPPTGGAGEPPAAAGTETA